MMRRYDVEEVGRIVVVDLNATNDAAGHIIREFRGDLQFQWPDAVVGPHGRVKAVEDFTLGIDECRVSLILPVVRNVPYFDRERVQHYLDTPRAKYTNVLAYDDTPEIYTDELQKLQQTVAEHIQMGHISIEDARRFFESGAAARYYLPPVHTNYTQGIPPGMSPSLRGPQNYPTNYPTVMPPLPPHQWRPKRAYRDPKDEGIKPTHDCVNGAVQLGPKRDCTYCTFSRPVEPHKETPEEAKRRKKALLEGAR
jgi:hypothetical protein